LRSGGQHNFEREKSKFWLSFGGRGEKKESLFRVVEFLVKKKRTLVLEIPSKRR